MEAIKVLLSRHLPDEVEKAFTDNFDVTLNQSDIPLTEAQWIDAFASFDVICPCVIDQLGKNLLQKIDKPRTRLLANFGVGYNHIDIATARVKGIAVTNTPDVLTDATADLAMTLLLMLARRAGEGERQLRAGAWTGWYPTHLMGSMASGKTLGIIGMGRIGLAMATRASKGFGMDILYHNRRPIPKESLGKIKAEYFQNLEEMLPQCDFLSLHCPGGESTRHILNAASLSKLPQHAFVINTSRGDVIDEPALIQALQEKTIAGAGLDVYSREPVIPPEFLTMENVVLLPHLGSATRETRIAMGMRVLNNVKAFLAGKNPPDLVTP